MVAPFSSPFPSLRHLANRNSVIAAGNRLHPRETDRVRDDLDNARLALRACDGKELPALSLQLFAPKLQLALQRNSAAFRLDDPRVRERDARRDDREVEIPIPNPVMLVVRKDDGLRAPRLQQRLRRLAASTVT